MNVGNLSSLIYLSLTMLGLVSLGTSSSFTALNYLVSLSCPLSDARVLLERQDIPP